MLKGKAAIVTGSTSGIGLGIATALAAQGCSMMLNGFGEVPAIEALRTKLEREHVVTVGYSPADMSRPAQIRELVAETAVIAMISNCPQRHNPCSGFNPTDIEVIVSRQP